MVETVGGIAAIPRAVIENIDMDNKGLELSVDGDTMLVTIVNVDETEDKDES